MKILSSNIGDNKEIYLPLFIGRGILFHLQTCESKLEKMIKGCSQCGRVFDVKILTESAYEGYKIHINKCGQLILCEICGETFKGRHTISTCLILALHISCKTTPLFTI